MKILFSLHIIFLLLFSALSALAQSVPSNIEAEEFSIQLLKSSKSGRVGMFQDISDNRPKPGKILLLKEGKTDVAAVRILKNYDKKFAARIVLKFQPLAPNQPYRALKKVGVRLNQMIAEREKRLKQIDETRSDENLSLEINPDDNELDRGIPNDSDKKKPQDPALNPAKADEDASSSSDGEKLFTKDGDEIDFSSFELKEEEELSADLTAQDELPLEPYRHVVSLQYAMIRDAANEENKIKTYNGVAGRYGFNFWKMAFLKKKALQDMFTAEASLYFYRISGFADPLDLITVVPVLATIRYNWIVGESLVFFLYLGMVKNFVSQSGAVLVQTTALEKTTFVGGAGGFIRIGPSWSARLDFGTDAFAIGASLKF